MQHLLPFQESLNELEEMVLQLFSGVENKNVTVPEWTTHPFGAEQCRKAGYVIPVKDIRNLYITFPIPDLNPHYKSAVSHTLTRMFPYIMTSRMGITAESLLVNLK